MKTTYESYLQEPDKITFNECAVLLNSILDNADEKHEDFLFLWENVVKASAGYTATRANWTFLSRVDKGNKGQARTNEHNGVINTFVILARFMTSQSWDVTWSETLGLNSTDVHRKRIGDFANYITFVSALNGR